MFILIIPVQHCNGSPNQYNKTKTKGGEHKKREKKTYRLERKLFLFMDDIIIYVDYTKEPIK